MPTDWRLIASSLLIFCAVGCNEEAATPPKEAPAPRPAPAPEQPSPPDSPLGASPARLGSSVFVHDQPITQIVGHPGRLLTADRSDWVRLWDVEERELLRQWPGSPRGRPLVGLGRDRVAFVGDDDVLQVALDEGEPTPVPLLAVPGDALMGADVGLNLAVVVTGGSAQVLATNTGSAVRWDLPTGFDARLLSVGPDRIFLADRTEVRAFSIAGDTHWSWRSTGPLTALTASEQVVAAAAGSRVVVLEAKDGRPRRQLDTGEVSALAVAGDTIAVGHRELVVYGRNETTLDFPFARVRNAAFVGRDIVAFDVGGNGARLFDSIAGEEIQLGHSGPVSTFDFSTDGKLLASGGHDGSVMVWDLDRLAKRNPPQPGVPPTRLHASKPRWTFATEGPTVVDVVLEEADGEVKVVDATSSGTIRVWDLETGGGLIAYRVLGGTLLTLGRGEMSRTTVEVVGHRVALWDEHRTLVDLAIDEDKGPVTHADMSADGRYVVVATTKARISVFDRRTNVRVAIPQLDGAPLVALEMADSGYAIAWTDGEAVWVNLEDFPVRQVPRNNDHKAKVTELALSGNGKSLAVGFDDGSVVLYDARARTETQTLAEEAVSPVTALAFDEDADRLAIGRADSTIDVELVRSTPQTTADGKEREPPGQRTD